MKSIIFSILFSLFATSSAFAMMEYHNDIMDELEVTAEMGEMDILSDDALAKHNRELSKKLDREARKMKGDVSRLNRKKVRTKNKANRMAQRYQKSFQHKKKVEVDVNKAKKEQQQSKAEYNKLKTKVDKLEAKAMKLIAQKKRSKKQLLQSKRVQSRLKQRKKTAERLIARLLRQNQQLTSQKHNLRKSNRKLHMQVNQLESTAVKGLKEARLNR